MRLKNTSLALAILFCLLLICLPANVHSFNVSFSLQIGSVRGNTDGMFYGPTGTAMTDDGKVYIVDAGNNRIQIFNSDGQFIKTFGTKGTGDGQFRSPYGIAIAKDGRLFITDSRNGRVQVFDNQGGFLYSFGSDGSGDGELSYPLGIALDEQERVFVADSGNSRIAVFTTDGLFLDIIGSKGSGREQLYKPAGVAVSADEKVWIADTGNNRLQIFDTQGNYLFSVGNGAQGTNKLSEPAGVTVDAQGRIIVADTNNNKLHVLNSKGVFLTSFGSKGTGRAQFIEPQSVYLHKDMCYVADTGNNRIQVFALGKEESASQPQPLSRAIHKPRVSLHKTITASVSDIAVDSKNNLILLDGERGRVIIMDTDGHIISEFGGLGKTQGMFNKPWGIVLDKADNIYVSDTGNNRVQAFDSSGKYLFEFGSRGSGDGQLSAPEGILYLKGKLLVSDTGNNRIQLFSKDGIYLSQFGKRGSEDGMFNQPRDIAANSREELYVADYGNSKVQIFSKDGRFLKTLGNRGEGRGEFTNPLSISIDGEDRVFVLESYRKNRVHVFDNMGRYLRGFGASGKGRLEMDKASAIAHVFKPDDIFLAVADTGNKRLQILSLKDVPSKAPDSIHKTPLEDGSVDISWTKAEESFVKGYKIYAAKDPAGDFTAVAETPNPLFNLKYKEEYQYPVYGIATIAKGGLEGPMAVIYPMGFLLFSQKNYGGAIQELEKVVRIDSENMDTYLLLAKSLNAMGKSGDAMNILKTAIEINKGNHGPRIELGKIYMENNLLEKAISEFQSITDMAPKDALAYNLLGKAFLKKKMYGEAVEALSTASRLNPSDVYKQDLNAAYEAKKREEQGKLAGPLIDIQSVTINKVFSSLYKFYNTTPIGEIRITNNSAEIFPKIKVSLKVLAYMDFSTDKEIKDVKPGTTEIVPLYASFNNRILEIVEDTPAQAAIEVSYYVGQKEEKTTLNIPFTIYNRNAITWITPAMAATFITPKDEPVKDLARGLVQMYPESPSALINKQIATAMLVFDALGAYGMVYSPDPNNPYEKVSMDIGAIDSLQYPRETLKLKTGDCDDLSVLMAALLENLGIETALIGTPGHLHLMFMLDIDPGKADTVSSNPEQYIIFENRVWIPVEATDIGSSFNEAWYKGSEIYNRWEKEKKTEVTKVHDAWAVYQPATLPPATWSPPLPTKGKIDDIMAREMSLQKAKRILGFIKPYQDALEKNPNDLNIRMQISLLYAENGFYAEAIEGFNSIIGADRVNSDAYANIGNIQLLTGKIDNAIETYKRAEAIKPDDEEIKINLAIAYYKKGLLKEARAKFKEAVDIKPMLQYEKGFLDSLLFR